MPGNIPTYQAKQKLLPIAGGARAWPEMMTREQRAMAQFGGAMGNVAFKWQAERDNFEISRLDAEIDNFHYTALRQLEEDWIGGKFTDADQFKQIEDDYEKARKKKLATLIKGKRGLIADRVAQYAENNEVPDKTSFYTSLFPKEKEFRAVEALKTIEGYKQQRDADKALMAIEQNKYWLGLNKAEVLKANLAKDIAAYQHQQLLEKIATEAAAKEYKDAIPYLNSIPRTAISEAERNSLIKQRETQKKIEMAVTDTPTYSRLFTMANDIWRGVVTKDEFDAALEKALIAGQLENDDARALAKAAETTLKAAQAEGLSRADREAGRLIVDYREEDAWREYMSDVLKGLKPDVSKLFESEANKRRQFQFWWLSRYNQELRNWITEHPDKLGKDFYEYSEMLKHQYWNTGIEEIKKLKRKRDIKMAAKQVVTEMPPEERGISGRITKAEYDNLKPGSKYIAPDGSRRIKK